jgi:hypothetical protein
MSASLAMPKYMATLAVCSRRNVEMSPPTFANSTRLLNTGDLERPHGLIRKYDAGSGTRTRTELALQRILSPLCLPFHHPGEGRREAETALNFFSTSRARQAEMT